MKRARYRCLERVLKNLALMLLNRSHFSVNPILFYLPGSRLDEHATGSQADSHIGDSHVAGCGVLLDTDPPAILAAKLDAGTVHARRGLGIGRSDRVCPGAGHDTAVRRVGANPKNHALRLAFHRQVGGCAVGGNPTRQAISRSERFGQWRRGAAGRCVARPGQKPRPAAKALADPVKSSFQSPVAFLKPPSLARLSSPP